MQRHLRALAHRAYKEQQADQRRNRPFHRAIGIEALSYQFRSLLEDRGVVQTAEVGQHQTDTEQKAEIAHPVDQKGLEVGEDGGRPLVPEADQEVRHQANRFPAEEQLHEVVAHHQHQHREGEQRDVGEEALVARIIVHVADGVDVHHQRYRGHHHHHGRGERVNQKADLGLDRSDLEPGVDRKIHRQVRIQRNQLEHVQAEHRADGDAEDGDPVRAGAADLTTEQAGQDGAEQRRQGDGEEQGLGNHLSPASDQVRRR